MSGERVWFMGPWKGAGYYMMVSTEPGKSERARAEDGSFHRPTGFPWRSMDRDWGTAHKPQGTAVLAHDGDWSVLSVADYTEDSRPNVAVTFAVERPNVPRTEMKVLAWERYPSVWKRLGVPTDNEEARARVESLCQRLEALDVPSDAIEPIRRWAASTFAAAPPSVTGTREGEKS